MDESKDGLERALALMWHLDGLYVGQLTLSELEAFGLLRRAGLAETVYGGAGGFLGMGKVRLTTARTADAKEPT